MPGFFSSVVPDTCRHAGSDPFHPTAATRFAKAVFAGPTSSPVPDPWAT
jgi:hypothetical protein